MHHVLCLVTVTVVEIIFLEALTFRVAMDNQVISPQQDQLVEEVLCTLTKSVLVAKQWNGRKLIISLMGSVLGWSSRTVSNLLILSDQSIYFSGHGEHKSKAFIFLSQVKQHVNCKLHLDPSRVLPKFLSRRRIINNYPAKSRGILSDT